MCHVTLLFPTACPSHVLCLPSSLLHSGSRTSTLRRHDNHNFTTRHKRSTRGSTRPRYLHSAHHPARPAIAVKVIWIARSIEIGHGGWTVSVPGRHILVVVGPPSCQCMQHHGQRHAWAWQLGMKDLSFQVVSDVSQMFQSVVSVGFAL